ncbi:hypothetical protein P5G50_06830 [Leifsonia sp. F6_8S_P_1B]|uniref:Uncharacterized protein n=1 Tax=Leifsonia williamsii TaxID=3035919 RepID=A0ABT8K9P1_9MICO|nr:hypothetical protein [Leifsonia williamsii]MDN4614165.1 hypothetical protein [Leifsonia williamsii]
MTIEKNDIPEDETVAVEHAAERLAERFPEVPRARIDELVEKHHEEFDDAAVRDFVPVLVEHEVKKDLTAGS